MLTDYVAAVVYLDRCVYVYKDGRRRLTIALPVTPWRVAPKPHTDLVAVTSYTQKVFIIDIATGQTVHTLLFTRDTYGVTFSRDGTLLFVGVHDTVEVWDTASADPAQWRRLQGLQGLQGHEGWMCDTEVTHDNATIVTGDSRGTVIVWVLNSTTQMYEEHQRITATHNRWVVWGAAITDDGSHIFAATREGLRMLRKQASGVYEHVYTVAGYHPAHIRLSRDGSMLVVTDKVYRTSDLSLLHDFKIANDSTYTRGRFSSDGSLVAVTPESGFAVYKSGDGSPVNKYELSTNVTDVCFVSRSAPASMCVLSRIVQRCFLPSH